MRNQINVKVTPNRFNDWYTIEVRSSVPLTRQDFEDIAEDNGLDGRHRMSFKSVSEGQNHIYQWQAPEERRSDRRQAA